MTDPVDPAPLHETIAGERLVSIPASHYAELLAYRRTVLAMGPVRQRERGARPSILDAAEPEIAAFLREQFAARLSIERAMWEAQRAFPNKRQVISYQRVRSLWHKVRSEAAV